MQRLAPASRTLSDSLTSCQVTLLSSSVVISSTLSSSEPLALDSSARIRSSSSACLRRSAATCTRRACVGRLS
jgi:hypothetical protein